MIVGWGTSETVGQWDSEDRCHLTAVSLPLSAVSFRLPASGCPLSAIRYPLTAGHSHSERSEESRYVSLVPPLLINTCRRGNIRHTVFLSAEGRAPEASFYMWL